ncbi:phospholipid carrier-dependent glycosyltransferase [Candidatus Parcubacteria bacterium]|nr:MAG: phospholipid carrier-dependent glycosyltransferase [Candidatus Parcubacteria bacterium]
MSNQFSISVKSILRYKSVIILLFLLCVLYFSLRLPNLTLQPIFADEAIYIRWAQVMKAEPTLRFLPLSDGKTPLFMWAMMPLFKIFQDPLLAGRILSVFSGFLTLLGVFFLGWKFFGTKVGLWSAFLIAITPFMVFFDRMALVDSLLAAFSIWSLNLVLLLTQYRRLDIAIFLGYALGGGLLTKTPAMFNLLILPVTLVAFNWKINKRSLILVRTIGLWIVAIVTALVIYNLLRLGPGFENLNSRNQDYVFSFWELKDRPLDPFIPHLRDLTDWLPKMLTWPILSLALGGVASVFYFRNYYGITIVLWFLIPLLAEMIFYKTFTTRYILFTIPPLLLLAGWFISKLENRFFPFTWNKMLLVLFLAMSALHINYYLLTNPAKSFLPQETRRGYLADWTAGYGFKEIAQQLIKESKYASIVVGTEGTFGTLPDGLLIYLDSYFHQTINPRISVLGGGATISASLRKAAEENKTYFIANRSRFSQLPKGVTVVKEIPKIVSTGMPQDAIIFLQVFPEK